MIHSADFYEDEIEQTYPFACYLYSTLKDARERYERLKDDCAFSFTSPLGCFLCAVTFFLLSWGTARIFGLFDYVRIGVIVRQATNGGMGSEALWFLTWPLSILLSWALVPVIRSVVRFDTADARWAGLTKLFISLQLVGAWGCVSSALHGIEEPTRETIEAFGGNAGTAVLFMTLAQIACFCLSNARAAGLEQARREYERAQENYYKRSVDFLGSYADFHKAQREEQEARRHAEEERRRREEEKRRQEAERRREEEQYRDEADWGAHVKSRLGNKYQRAYKLRALMLDSAVAEGEHRNAEDALWDLFLAHGLTCDDFMRFTHPAQKRAA